MKNVVSPVFTFYFILCKKLVLNKVDDISVNARGGIGRQSRCYLFLFYPKKSAICKFLVLTWRYKAFLFVNFLI